jgi:hypothetical protein
MAAKATAMKNPTRQRRLFFNNSFFIAQKFGIIR